MKITRVEPIPINVPLKQGLTTKTAHGEHIDSPYVLVRLHSDEEPVGLGHPDEPAIDAFMRPEREMSMEEAQPAEPQEERTDEVPFYRKAIANSRDEDPGGYGPNWSNVDDYDIPTVLRKQMD